MNEGIQNWAFVAPKFSRDLSQYFEGFVDFVKDDPAIFAHAFVYDDPNLSALQAMDGIVTYVIPRKK